MRITSSDIYTYYNPSPCELRLFLAARGEEKSPPSAFEEVIFRLGREHECRHLATLDDVVDLGDGTLDERIVRTTDEIATQTHAIYQGVLKTDVEIGGEMWEVLGIPDFLIPDGEGGYIVRDSKMALTCPR